MWFLLIYVRIYNTLNANFDRALQARREMDYKSTVRKDDTMSTRGCHNASRGDLAKRFDLMETNVAFPLRPCACHPRVRCVNHALFTHKKHPREREPRFSELSSEKETWSSSLTCHEGWTSEEQLRDDVNR